MSLDNLIGFFLALFLLGNLSACAPSLPLYLKVWDAELPATVGTGQATLLIQPFDASNWSAKPIGELYSWQSSQQIYVDSQALANGLTSKFERLLAMQGYTCKKGSWVGTLTGLRTVAPGYRAVISGTISQLRIDSEKQGVQTVSRLRLTVDCLIGLPGQQTLLTRQVKISQEQTHFLQEASVLEDLLNQGLEEAATRLSAELKKALSSSPAPE